MIKSLTPVLGDLDNGIVTSSLGSVSMTINANGKPQNVVRSMQQYDLSDYIDEVTATTNADAIYAEAGDDKIYGDAGDDYINGGAGMDTLYGGAGNDHLVGGIGGDYLQGDAGNDVLEGGAGLDTLRGGEGDDLYIVWDNDTITEYSGQGTDTVVSALKTYTLGANIENLIADTSQGVMNFDFTGNELDNRITGGQYSYDVLRGGAGNDTLDGGAGGDSLFGGTGNDRYYVDDANDEVFEKAGEGTDTVYATVSRQLEFQVENLVFENKPGAPTTGYVGYGNDLGNTLMGANGDDKLYGLAGSDYLNGGAGNNTLYGGQGDDFYTLWLGNDTVVEYAGEGTDLISSNLATTTLPDNVENLEFFVTVSGGQVTGNTKFTGIGNALDNTIKGWDSDDVLQGMDGNDHLFGGDGNDKLEGGNGDDYLDGGAGTNKLIGGAGNDTYLVTDMLKTTITEAADGGFDTMVSYDANFTMPKNVEALRYDGTGHFQAWGNDSNNSISGSKTGTNYLKGGAGNDLLIGGSDNDYLNGDEGDDTMQGGAGDDKYYVDSAGDKIIELAGGGTYDSVYTALATYQMDANVDRLYLTDAGNHTAYGSAEKNVMYGNDGVDTLFGMNGDDALVGGAGNDFLYGGNGNDTLYGDTGNDTLHGGAGDDRIYGGDGDDLINGGTGNDILLGEAGKDIFQFSQYIAGTGSAIHGFVRGEDKIDLSKFDGNLAVAGDQQMAFSFNGQLVGGGQGSFCVEKTTGDYGWKYTTLHVDVTGDGQRDFDITLAGSDFYNLSLSDFVM